MLAAGHHNAREYPLGYILDEAKIVVDRDNGLEATRAVLLQMAVASILSDKAGKTFQQMIARLNGG